MKRGNSLARHDRFHLLLGQTIQTKSIVSFLDWLTWLRLKIPGGEI